ncbi:hypothetical protein BT96DRAFT_403174 [Gymnopus androsaceus JB14]|uniref:Uncharacterized protein n=1 Tax=Gymnopus androsaceus JB14 TaxID=1447944 RepID=A0A6A4HZ56_9AGAR|nr:hypothetical protein BT96DRAFT_403174 [Gymnopus androsaceus JB14]
MWLYLSGTNFITGPQLVLVIRSFTHRPRLVIFQTKNHFTSWLIHNMRIITIAALLAYATLMASALPATAVREEVDKGAAKHESCHIETIVECLKVFEHSAPACSKAAVEKGLKGSLDKDCFLAVKNDMKAAPPKCVACAEDVLKLI